jgi:hypothetical protein
MSQRVSCDCEAPDPKNRPGYPENYCTCTNSAWVAKAPRRWICSDCSSGRHKF